MQSATSITPLDPSSYVLTLSALIFEPPRSNIRPQPGGQPPPAPTPGTSMQEMKSDAMERIRELKGLLRSLVDLSRVE